MAPRKSAARKPGSIAALKSEEITDEDLDDAVRVIRAHYYQEVRRYADDLLEAVKDGEITDDEQLTERLDQEVDGSARVIYTFKSKLGLLASDNDEAYEDEMGEPTNDVAIQMAFAMRQDIREAMGDVEFPEED